MFEQKLSEVAPLPAPTTPCATCESNHNAGMHCVECGRPEPLPTSFIGPIRLDTNRLGHIFIDQEDKESPFGTRVILTPEQAQEVAQFIQKLSGGEPLPAPLPASSPLTPKFTAEQWAERLMQNIWGLYGDLRQLDDKEFITLVASSLTDYADMRAEAEVGDSVVQKEKPK